MADITIKEIGTRELWEQFRQDPIKIYTETARYMQDKGIEETPTMSRVLEINSPSEKDDRRDAFTRLMQEANIRTKSDPVAGYWASKSIEFTRNAGTRALFMEFYAREWRKVSHADRTQRRAIFLNSDNTAGSWERPYADAMMPRWDQQIAPAIPLAELVAMTTPIDGQDYRALYLTYDAEELRRYRVNESADIPIATLTDADNTIKLHKYGRGLQASYEQLRRTRADKMARFIQYSAIQAEIDKVAAALNVLVNGDGNSGTAPTTHNLTTLDTDASAGTLTLKGWLAYKMKFAQPYVVTTALMQEATALQLILLNIGSANVPLAQLPRIGGIGQELTPINQTSGGVRYGWTSDAPSLKIVGFDNRFALERVTEIGAEISEMERYITNQTQIMTMTEVEGYMTLDPSATLLLDVNS